MLRSRVPRQRNEPANRTWEKRAQTLVRGVFLGRYERHSAERISRVGPLFSALVHRMPDAPEKALQ
jgi:hypothetical protein